MKMLYRLLIVVAVAMGPTACGTTGSGPGSGSETTAPGSYISGSDRGIAIEGYDPVAYHTEGEAVRGSPDHTVQWAGTKWLFASKEHRDMFREDPERYAPEYGGHCALGVAYGETPRGRGDVWHVRAGDLYLFGGKTAREDWLEGGTENFIQRADGWWPHLRERMTSG